MKALTLSVTNGVFETTYSPFLLQMSDDGRCSQRLLWLITVTVHSHGPFMVIIRFPSAPFRALGVGLALGFLDSPFDIDARWCLYLMTIIGASACLGQAGRVSKDLVTIFSSHGCPTHMDWRFYLCVSPPQFDEYVGSRLLGLGSCLMRITLTVPYLR